VGKTNKVSVGKTARKTTNHVDERNSAGHVQGPMVHLISKLRKAEEDRFGSTPAVRDDRRQGPVFPKAAVPDRSSVGPNLANRQLGRRRFPIRIVQHRPRAPFVSVAVVGLRDGTYAVTDAQHKKIPPGLRSPGGVCPS
jgi:hypothetical protein